MTNLIILEIHLTYIWLRAILFTYYHVGGFVLMNEGALLARVPEAFARSVVTCVRKALNDDMHRYLSEFQPDTKNGIPHSIGDWINTNIRQTMISEAVDVIEFPRRSWKGKLIIDHANKFTITIVREKRLRQIVKNVKNTGRLRPHYIETLLRTINKVLEPKHRQLTLEQCSCMEFSFDDKTYEEDLKSIFLGSLDDREGYVHCIIAFETEKSELANIELLLLDKTFEVVETKNLKYLIAPDFAALTQTDIEVISAEYKSSSELVKLKNRNPQPTDPTDTPFSPVLPKLEEKKA